MKTKVLNKKVLKQAIEDLNKLYYSEVLGMIEEMLVEVRGE